MFVAYSEKARAGFNPENQEYSTSVEVLLLLTTLGLPVVRFLNENKLELIQT